MVALDKSYGEVHALRGMSLTVGSGEIVGFVGSNGAGKTTAMRIAVGVLAADSGEVRWDGRPVDLTVSRRIGYMPEERGLYPRMVLEEQLLFMAAIKGLSRKEAGTRLGPWLERLDLAGWRQRKTNELSKGMQQKAQFIATVLHEPDVLIMDEPMSGLDPVGMDVMRDVMLDLSRRGATIVLSSHQMDTVEKLCGRVALINKGQKVLDGAVSEIKAGHGKNTLVLAFDGDGSFLASLPGVARVSDFGQYVEIRMNDGADPQSILREAATRLTVRRFEIVVPSLHDVFVETVTGSGEEAA
jgi:ABC-2 type transport system ATP-binding protein